MPRQPRIQFPDAIYHVMARGDRREPIVRTTEDRKLFLSTLDSVCAMAGWLIHAWALLDNHYHLVLQTPKANLVDGMKWLQNTYTRRYNSRHKVWGHLFGGRYRSILVEKGDYFAALVDYVHLNPVRAGLVGHGESLNLLSYPWTSLVQGYVVEPSERPGWLVVEDRLAEDGLKDTASSRRAYVKRLINLACRDDREAGRRPEKEGLIGSLSRGWLWGSEQFREQMLKMVNGEAGNRNYASSPMQHDKDEQRAETMIADALKEARVDASELSSLPSRHPAKLAMLLAIRNWTTLGNRWIHARVGMRSAANVSQLYYLLQRKQLRLPREWQAWVDKIRNC